MGSLFKKPKVSKPKPVVISKPAEQDDAEKRRQADDEESRRKRAALASNLLFNEGEGPADGPAIAKKKLLGE